MTSVVRSSRLSQAERQTGFFRLTGRADYVNCEMQDAGSSREGRLESPACSVLPYQQLCFRHAAQTGGRAYFPLTAGEPRQSNRLPSRSCRYQARCTRPA
jgi:hypothetical protein